MQRVACEIDSRAHQAPAAIEFNRISREQGLKSALEWRDTKFGDGRGTAAYQRRRRPPWLTGAGPTENGMELAGRTALVIGAQRPLGRAIAVALGERGADVAVAGVAATSARTSGSTRSPTSSGR